MRVEEVQEVIAGRYRGDEVKGADIVSGGRARIIRKVFHEEDEDGIRRVTENEDIIWERFDRDDGERVICFTRRDKITLLEVELHGYQVPVIETCLWGVRPGEEILPANREKGSRIGYRVGRKILSSGNNVERFTERRETGRLVSGVDSGENQIGCFALSVGIAGRELYVEYLCPGEICESAIGNCFFWNGMSRTGKNCRGKWNEWFGNSREAGRGE